jgi:tetratricopeptide (TPR) repeat protein
MKDFLIDSNTVYEKGMQGYTALTIIEENLNRLDELLKEASNEINKHDELNMMYYQSLESDIQYLRDYQNKYQSFIGGTYNVNGDGGFVGEYKDTVDDPYYKQKEALLDKLGDLKLEDITVDNKLGITTNVQAFVGHTTMVKDKVNIRDILGFGNISDNIKKQYEESKALIEKYNEGLNTYNEADYPSILPSFAKKLWYNLTKKKEKTIDNYDDYLDAIIKSGDFNFETEGEKKLSIGLDFIPILGIEKMTLEGLLGEDLVSGRDLNGLERILSVAPAGIGAIAKVKNAIKLGEIGGKVEGSISFGMNGGGQLDNIISKLKQSKAEEDMVAKEAVTIDKGISNPESIPKRPSWRQSELDVQSDFPEYNPQKSFIDGDEVPYGTKGSSRPDFYKEGASIEVKNYKITTSEGRSRLINNISNQVNKRITDLPSGTAQTIIIDVRGQNVSNDVLRSIRDKILEKSNVNVNIQFKR